MMPLPANFLFAELVARIGRRQATQELKWMHNALNDMLTRRLKGEPLQYILGSQPFGPLNLLTRPPVLIPRPETEHWSIRLSEFISPTQDHPLALLDLGTGSGCIPLLLSHLCPPGSIHAIGVDISRDAIRLAEDNASRCGIPSSENLSANGCRNTFNPILASYLSPDFFDVVKPPFDIVTSNPPYISSQQYAELPPSVKDFEDKRALFGGDDGLDFYHHIARLVAPKGVLNPSAVVALEVGDGQADEVEGIMRDKGKLCRTEIWLDPWGKKRTVIGHA